MKAPQGAFLWLYAFDVFTITSKLEPRTGAGKMAIDFGYSVHIAFGSLNFPCTAFGLFFPCDNFVLDRAHNKLAASGVNFDWILKLLGGAGTRCHIGIQFGLAIIQQVGAVGNAI